MPDKHNHCLIVNEMSVCTAPTAHCVFWKEGREDCFYHVKNRCCHSVAILSRIETETVLKIEKEEKS